MNNSNINAKLLKVYLKQADVLQQMEAMEGGGGGGSPASEAAAMGMTPEQFAFASPEAVKARMAKREEDAKNAPQKAKDNFANQAMGIRTPEQQEFARSENRKARAQGRAIDSKGVPIANPKDQERAGQADARDRAKEQTPEWQAAQKKHERMLARQSFFRALGSPTDSAGLNYGIHGGIGALIGGGLGALMSGSKNRWRNALLLALLGGGIGVGGSYLANRPAAPMELPKA